MDTKHGRAVSEWRKEAGHCVDGEATRSAARSEKDQGLEHLAHRSEAIDVLYSLSEIRRLGMDER